MTQIQRNRISQKDFFSLAKYIEENKGGLAGKSKFHVASMASKALGFEVSEFHAANAAEAAGVELGRKNQRKSDKRMDRGRALARIVQRIVKELDMEDSLTTSQLADLNSMCDQGKQ